MNARCPDCALPLPQGQAPTSCPGCGLPLNCAEAAELADLTRELDSVVARRAELLQRRAVLLALLRARRRTEGAAAPPPLPARPPQAEAAPAQNALLTAGGLLILLAGLAFTLLNWSRFGIGGRTAVLGGLTCAVLAAPIPLRRRRLGATAETACAVGLGLVLLDAYAARAAGLGGLDSFGPDGYWAGVTALAAAGAAAYGRAGRSRVLPYAALLLAQLPAPLTAAGRHAHLTGLAYALVADAALSFAVAARTRVRHAATTAGVLTLASAVCALLAGDRADAYGPALNACGPLLLAAVLALAWALTADSPARGYVAALGGLALVSAVEVLAHQALPARWTPLGWAAPSALLAGAALAFRPRQHVVPRALFGAGAVVLGLAGVRELPSLGGALTGPLRGTWEADGVLPAVVGLCAAVAAGAAVRFGRAEVGCAAAVAGVAAAESAAMAAGWPYPAPIALAGALAVGATALLVRRPAAPWAVCVLLAAGGTALCWSLQNEAAALTVWAAGAALACGLAAAGRFAPPAAAFAVCALAMEAARASAAAGWPLHAAAFPILAVTAATAPTAAWLRTANRVEPPAARSPHGAKGPAQASPEPPHPARKSASTTSGLAPHPAAEPARPATAQPPHPAPGSTGPTPQPPTPLLSLAVEVSGYLVGVIALALSLGDADALSLALGVGGVIGGGVALRADRRRGAVIVAVGLVAGASWVRMGLAGVRAPEPYTVSVSCVLLALGWARRRRQAGVGSFSAYGAGLAATLGPSLVAAWADSGWVRPLLLGLSSLAVTLLGAHHRLRAPLLIGGAVLVADAAHELAPAVVQSLGDMPRWVPVALAGALLVYVGATYERRLVAARRIRKTYRALR